jgi:hypothetical protein
MPTYLLKQCLNNVLPVITAIVNKSLIEMSVPTAFKQAIVGPLLKKPRLVTLSMKMLIWISQRYIPNAGAKFHDQ